MDFRQRGRSDCGQDACENCPFASIGGLERRSAMEAPGYIPAEVASEYLAGYAEQAQAMYGDDWRTCSFGWGPAITIQARSTMNFGQALEALKEGKRVARSGWNGNNMWLCYMTPHQVPADKVNDRTRPFAPQGEHLNVGGYIVMWTAQQIWQPGWNASQSDLLADDWFILG